MSFCRFPFNIERHGVKGIDVLPLIKMMDEFFKQHLLPT